MGKQTNQYTKTRTAANSQAQDRMDWDSTEDGGTTFESAQMTRTELITLLSANVSTVYNVSDSLTSNRVVDGLTLYDFQFSNLSSFEANADASIQLNSNNSLGLSSISNMNFISGDDIILDPTGNVGIGTAAPTAALDIRSPVGSANPLYLYEDRVGGASVGDGMNLGFYYNDDLGTRTLGGTIETRIDAAPTTGDVNMSMTLNSLIKIQPTKRILITPNPATGAASALVEIRGDATTPNETLYLRSGSNGSASVLLVRNLANQNLIQFQSNGKNIFNSSKLSAGDFQVKGLTDDNMFYADASKDAIGIGLASPNNSAKLEITSTTKGIRQTPMTAAQAAAITAVEGLIVFVSDTDATFTAIGFWGYQNAAWTKM
jgi:hypothetical protein